MFPNLVYTNLATTNTSNATSSTTNSKLSKSDEKTISKANTSSSSTTLNQFIPKLTTTSNMSSKTKQIKQLANTNKFSNLPCSEPFMANLNVRAVLLSNLIQNSSASTMPVPTNPLNLLPNLTSQEQNLFNFNPFALAANEYFNNYFLNLNNHNINIQFDKVNLKFSDSVVNLEKLKFFFIRKKEKFQAQKKFSNQAL